MISNQLKTYSEISRLLIKALSALISIILVLTGLSQFPDALEKYFPFLYSHIYLNILPISLTLNVALSLLALLGLYFTKSYFIMIGHKGNTLQKNVEVISPSSEGSFYMEYFSNLAQKAALWPGPIRFTLTYHAPGTPFVNLEANLSGIRQRIANGSIDGIFIIPSDTSDQTRQIIKENQSKIIVLDVWPFEFDFVRGDEKAGGEAPIRINFVRGDEKAGGEKAASIATSYFRRLRLEEQEEFKKKKIGFLKGSDIIYENGRIESFKEHIKRFDPEIEIEEIGNFNYQRREVKVHIYNLFMANPEDLFQYSVIFASNDDMALGIRDGYTKLINNKQIDEKDQQKLPKIIGYDGTMLIRQYIQLRDSFILGSVDVKIEQQAKIAVESMYKLLTALEEKKTKKETKIEKIDKIIIPARCDNPLFFWQNN